MLKIVVAEDDFVISLLTRKMIEFLGHKVLATVTNGEDAVLAAQKHKPDVMLMDIRLEGDLDGIDAMHQIAEFANIPAIYLTANSDERNRARAAQTNMHGFCTKPIDFDELKMLLFKIKSTANI
ncbi:MAG TPA: response regulator [Bacteroidia bacterium]|nr:response regulator [Bacteroidia bacterium]